MTIIRSPFQGEADLPRILNLTSSMPLSQTHMLDLPWRLSSPAINEGHDAVFWENADGQALGFAAWQYYWAALDFFILPGPHAQTIETELFTWAEQRFRERDEERGYPLPYWIEFRDDDHVQQQLIQAHGFLLDQQNRYVIFQHSLTNLSPAPTLPDSFQLRSFKGEQEAAAYAELHRAAFESPSMTPEWRARTVRTPSYQPDLDLVITAPDGSLAAFCVGWFDPFHHIAQIEPIGVHPRFHRRGLARTLLLEMLQRFKNHGATSAIIEPSADNIPIQRACQSVGFHQTHHIHAKGKQLTPWNNQIS